MFLVIYMFFPLKLMLEYIGGKTRISKYKSDSDEREWMQ